MKLLTDQTAARLHDLLGDPGPSRHLPRRFGWRSPVFPFGPLWLFGISFDGATATVAPGALVWGSTIYESEEQEVAFSGGPQYIVWEFDAINKELSVLADPQNNLPEDDIENGLIRGVLYKIGFAAGAIYLMQVWQMGTIALPKFAPAP
jgi:hypothetical protein